MSNLSGVTRQISIVLLSSLIVALLACNTGSTDSKIEPKIQEVEAPGIQWTEATEAMDAAAAQGKDIFMFVYAPWCPKCEEFNASTFKDEALINSLNTHFVNVKLNAQGAEDIVWGGKTYSNPNYDKSKTFEQPNSYHELPIALGAEAIPNVLVMDQSANVLSSLQGLREANQLNWLVGNASGRYSVKYKR